MKFSTPDDCNRKQIGIQALYDNPDTCGYLYNENDYGLDPWRLIAGVDYLHNENKFVIEYGRSAEMKVDPDFIVYVSKTATCFTDEEKADMRLKSQ
jgi:hypothetical protein